MVGKMSLCAACASLRSCKNAVLSSTICCCCFFTVVATVFFNSWYCCCCFPVRAAFSFCNLSIVPAHEACAVINSLSFAMPFSAASFSFFRDCCSLVTSPCSCACTLAPDSPEAMFCLSWLSCSRRAASSASLSLSAFSPSLSIDCNRAAFCWSFSTTAPSTPPAVAAGAADGADPAAPLLCFSSSFSRKAILDLVLAASFVFASMRLSTVFLRLEFS
mmetsp:Transcript_88/g.271  ORF Transcript_88/g.271 Transcript_88/m.271 type:complete len:218 (+) Transcript_88:1383-2036(+)